MSIPFSFRYRHAPDESDIHYVPIIYHALAMKNRIKVCFTSDDGKARDADFERLEFLESVATGYYVPAMTGGEVVYDELVPEKIKKILDTIPSSIDRNLVLLYLGMLYGNSADMSKNEEIKDFFDNGNKGKLYDTV